MAFEFTLGEAAGCKSDDMLIDLSEQAPDALLTAKACDTDSIRTDLKQRGIKPVILPKSNHTAVNLSARSAEVCDATHRKNVIRRMRKKREHGGLSDSEVE
jgi:hypothetical protein